MRLFGLVVADFVVLLYAAGEIDHLTGRLSQRLRIGPVPAEKFYANRSRDCGVFDPTPGSRNVLRSPFRALVWLMF
jgi:hypothetical protein